jgi:hypothetical protein
MTMGAEEKNAKPVNQLDNVAVGHAGLYFSEDDTMEESVEKVTKVLTTFAEIMCDIPLGIKDGGKTLITCEKGIKAFVRDELAKKENHLPNSEIGVWIHYLTEGIKRDFGRSWEELPRSIKPKPSKAEKAAESGKRIISKAEKNELLDKLDMKYYSNDIAAGVITLEQAFASIKEALAKKQELEDAGYYLSPNKTEGVKAFNWQKVVEDSVGNANAALLYKKEKVEVVLPNVIKNFYQNEKRIKRSICKDVMNSVLYGTAFKKVYASGWKEFGYYDEDHPEAGGFENFDVKDMNDLLKYLASQGREDMVKELKSSYTINATHLVKLKKAGFMKDRWLCLDTTNKKTGLRQLMLLGKSGSTMTLKEQD